MFTKTISFVAALAITCLFVSMSAVVPEVAVAGSSKVEVCHIPPGDPENFHTISVGEKALAAHLAHGDVAGDCVIEPPQPDCPCFGVDELNAEYAVSNDALADCGAFDGTFFPDVSDGDYVLYNNFSLACSGDTGVNCTGFPAPSFGCGFATEWNGMGGWNTVLTLEISEDENTTCRALLQAFCANPGGGDPAAPQSSSSSSDGSTDIIPSIIQ